MGKVMLIESTTQNPGYNLALEEYLLSFTSQYDCILYLWQNQNTVVIGRHQNPWQECNLSLMEKEGVVLARRLSGGGAVYQDLGNLNFTFIMPRKNYDFQRQAGVILHALSALGIQGEISGRNDLLVQGRKFSGNAFLLREKQAYHHGTLLVDVDQEKMSRYLQVDPEKLKAKGVTSVKSRVINLRECLPSLTIAQLKEALKTSFAQEYGDYEMRQDLLAQPEAFAFAEKYSAWDWVYGKSPQFSVEHRCRFPWGGISFYFDVQNGYIRQLQIYSDAMDDGFITDLQQVFIGVPYQPLALQKALLGHCNDTERDIWLQDLADWFGKKDF